MLQVNLNTAALDNARRTLNTISRSAFPVSVRQTLNNAAFDVKKNTLEQSATRNFVRRTPNFFKTFSAVNKAEGFKVDKMRAEVGMTANGKPRVNKAISHMVQQERGGSINEGADYLKAARAGNNNRKVVRSNYFDKNKLVTGAFKKARTKKSQYIAAAYVAMREKKKLSVNTSNGRYLLQVTKVWKYRHQENVNVRGKLLIKDRNGDPVRISATNFSREAAQMTIAKMPQMFVAEANKRIARAVRN